ncbi:MAG: transglycosylase SLT domain-containing protein [Nitrospira sp.]|nr:transglycosylase SLT domain-containing protein [Nitrospira sp.]MCP9440966.1 transglycosylase SLT domain-containing protein [Nitrospira sp.]
MVMPLRSRHPGMMTKGLITPVCALLLLLPIKTGATVDRLQSNSDSVSLVGDPGEEDLDSNLVPLDPDLDLHPEVSTDIQPTTEEPDGAVAASAESSAVSESNDQTARSTNPDGDMETDVYNIPVVRDPVVESHLRFFHTSIRDRFEQWLLRLSRYRPLIESIFSEFDLPSDLINLSLVESGFNPYAYSRAKATGPWQFMKTTGKIYGLRIDHYVDERRDPIKSTVAAARYLRDLYDLFGTWPLAMAAYNAGEGKVLRALQKAQAETFWDISKTKLIRQETKHYVPRIMAATIIARNPDRYGFNPNPVPPHQFEEVVIDRPLHFRAIANHSGIPYEELRLLNPELRRDATPPDDPMYHLKVPVGTAEKLRQVLDRIPTYKFPPLPPHIKQVKQMKAEPSRWYRVRAGDTLEKISKRFRVPVKTLKAQNNLSHSFLKAGEMLLIRR